MSSMTGTHDLGLGAPEPMTSGSGAGTQTSGSGAGTHDLGLGPRPAPANDRRGAWGAEAPPEPPTVARSGSAGRATTNRRRRMAAATSSIPKLRFGIETHTRLSTKRSSWRRLRHSKTPSQNVVYSPMIESPVSQ